MVRAEGIQAIFDEIEIASPGLIGQVLQKPHIVALLEQSALPKSVTVPSGTSAKKSKGVTSEPGEKVRCGCTLTTTKQACQAIVGDGLDWESGGGCYRHRGKELATSKTAVKVKKTCAGKTKTGEPCKAPVGNSKYCWRHEPEDEDDDDEDEDDEESDEDET